jgi:hypothetical protein
MSMSLRVHPAYALMLQHMKSFPAKKMMLKYACQPQQTDRRGLYEDLGRPSKINFFWCHTFNYVLDNHVRVLLVLGDKAAYATLTLHLSGVFARVVGTFRQRKTKHVGTTTLLLASLQTHDTQKFLF